MEEMGRIRTIKPEFPQSESIGRVSRDARLLLLQLLTLVDDKGRCRAQPRYLVGQLYAYDDDALGSIEDWLAELVRENHIVLYQAEGSSYLEIINFLKHQKIERPSPSKIPALTETSENNHRSLTEASPKDSGSLSDGPGPGPGPGPVSDSCVVSDHTVEEHFDRFWSIYPKREGGDPKKPAFEKFRSAVNGAPTRKPVDPNVIIAGAQSFADECERKHTEPRYVPMAKAWLHQARWESYTAAADAKDQAVAEFNKKILVFEDTHQGKAWEESRRAERGVGVSWHDIRDPVTGRFRPGAYFDSEWPSGHSDKQAA